MEPNESDPASVIGARRALHDLLFIALIRRVSDKAAFWAEIEGFMEAHLAVIAAKPNPRLPNFAQQMRLQLAQLQIGGAAYDETAR